MMRKRWIVGTAVSGLLLLGACGEEPAPAAPVVRPVRILEIGDATGGQRVEYPGEVSPAQNADIAFEVAGKLVEFPVKESQIVTRGDILAKLDPRDYQTRLDAAKARAGASKADWDRFQVMFDKDVVSKQELERAQRNYEVTLASEKTARKALEDAVLRAPFDGTVARKLVDDFANVQAKEPVVTLQTGSALEIDINVPEQDFARIRPGATVEELNVGLNADVIVSAIPDRKFPAKLKEFATTADPTTRTFKVTFSFDTPDDLNVVSGMTAKLVGLRRGDQASGAFRVPVQAAVEDESGNPYVWLVEPGSMKVRKAPVTLGTLTGSEVEVESGLSSGDLVVTSGVHQLQEGTQVSRLGS